MQNEAVVENFEAALNNAIREEITNAEFRGYYFHFCQEIWKRYTALDCQSLTERIETSKCCYIEFMSIRFLLAPMCVGHITVFYNEKETNN